MDLHTQVVGWIKCDYCRITFTLKFYVQISALILKSNLEHKYWKYLLLVYINSLMRGYQISTFTSYYDLSYIFTTLSEQLENVWP